MNDFPAPAFENPSKQFGVDRGASIGAGAIIAPGVRIGCYATVGAGSVVTHHVPAHTLVFGNPARVHGWVCVCGLRLNAGERGGLCVCNCGKKYEITHGMCQLIEIGIKL